MMSIIVSMNKAYWIHPQTNEMVLQSSPFIANGAVMSLNSFVGHSFQLREIPGKKSGLCRRDQCFISYVTVSENDDQVVFINENFEVKFQDNKSKAYDESQSIMKSCIVQTRNALSSYDGSLSSQDAIDMIDRMGACMENEVANRIEKLNDEIQFQSEIRQNIAYKLENYTCADEDAPPSESIENVTWTYYKDDIPRDVEKLMDRDASKVYLVRNFISPEECAAVGKAAEPDLHRATVADGDGGSQITDSRKAMQAGISVNWARESSGDPIARLSRRVYDFTNYVTGYGLKEHGQEDLMSIQYFGENYQKGEPPDRYTPHCDGNCNGMDYVWGNRVATMVMYCELPEIGGATQFQNAG